MRNVVGVCGSKRPLCRFARVLLFSSTRPRTYAPAAIARLLIPGRQMGGSHARGAAGAAAATSPHGAPAPPVVALAHPSIPGFAFPSETLTLAAVATSGTATNTAPRLRILVLPGNPGAAAFYGPFLARLHARLGGGADVVALSLHGHEAGVGDAPGPAWRLPPSKRRGEGGDGRPTRPSLLLPVTGLDGQVAHAAAAAAGLAETGSVCGRGDGPPAPLALVGHSIGALIALRAAALLEEGGGGGAGGTPAPVAPAPAITIPSVVALMPYLAFNASAPQQRALRLATRRPGRVVAAVAAAGLARLPGRVQRSILRGVTGGEGAAAAAAAPGAPRTAGLAPHAAGAVLAFLAAGGTRHALGLAATEFRQLGAPGFAPEWGLLARLGRRGAAFYADGDHWCPAGCGSAGLAAAAAAAPDATVRLLPDQRHDFPVCEARSLAAADAVADALLLRIGARDGLC